MSVKDVDLHICICICTSHCLHIAARCRRCFALTSRRLADLVSDLALPVYHHVIVGHVTAAVPNSAREFYSLLGQTLLVKGRQCCELWREVELGVHAVWAVSYTTDNDVSRSAVLFATQRHCRELSVHRSQCNFGVLRQLTPAANYPAAARPTTPAVRSVGAACHSVRQLAHRLLQPLYYCWCHSRVFYYVRG